ncbi:Pyoverdine/dityrosine biosynthesis protein-domain-containing protein [Triangularia verruculosa]|uniref:Pyoverdine/dityrosine biosynthesis protein-domain-containing protein n=1 Tax=Triangularia verruculosa TaxID=2587418 RepID=A0AAN6X734_9PEZI|nr:Pyoverdine/dityrosine biosynthesis protein-domain-containing protein [Triangularia verruculosa]
MTNTYAFDNMAEVDEALVKKASAILKVIYKYRLNKSESETSDSHDMLKFFVLIYDQVRANQTIKMCLPAFPFKSPNDKCKVLGRLPDMAEQFALAHLNGLCASIEDIYPPGAELTIISDGLVYNDLLGVPDKHVWAYGQALRELAVEKGFSNNIKFSRLQDLLHIFPGNDLDEITYVSNATEFRRALLNTFGRPDFDASVEICCNEDTCMTYRGYIKFLETDLKHVYPLSSDRSKSKFKKGTEYIAKNMLMRGDAFARAVRERFPNHLRLSIHQKGSVAANTKNKAQTNTKLPISLLPNTSPGTTPWHCCLGLKADGTILSLPRNQFEADPDFELILDANGNGSYFREKSSLFSWGDLSPQVWCEPLYPCGLLIRPFTPNSIPITSIPILHIRALAEHNAPICLRSFAKTISRELFIQKAKEMGPILGWPGRFEDILYVKDTSTDVDENGDPVIASQSAEKMAFHYDGIFRTTRDPETGKLSSLPPRFQIFVAVTPSPSNTGLTLFAASRLLFRYLQENHKNIPLEVLKECTMSVTSPVFGGVTLTGLPLVVDHPTTTLPCLRYHEHWPQSKTKFAPSDSWLEISSKGETLGLTDEFVRGVLDELLYDRRVCYRHAWNKGDVVVSDDWAMMHTRTEFVSGSNRELWRIHIK